MPSGISPKFKRNVTRIVPFGLIWLLIGWFFSLSEALLPQSQNAQSPTDIQLTLPIFIFAAFSLTSLGLLIGTLETLVLQKRFLEYSFLRKIAVKFIIYMSILLLAISITYPTAAALESDSNVLNPDIWNKTGNFLLSSLFFNALLQLSFSLFLSLLYSAISENLGHNVLLNFFTGKYHKPVVEKRVFMFLDMKDSTTIAETLGHVRYFEFLQAYYNVMSDPIINSLGEVYQYIGDEVVITWTAEKGFQDNNCLKCFARIKANLVAQAPSFEKKFGIVPDFKAGVHVGEVTTGEIGALKKEIVYSGDVLNTAARIQGLCQSQQSDLIVSKKILSKLEKPSEIKTRDLGEFQLKGKEEPVVLCGVE